MVRKTKEEALATRAQLLDAAECVFSQQGVAHASLADVASAAGVTRGAVYWHFQNKSDLLFALWERVALPMQHSLDGIRSEFAHDPLAMIRAKSRWVFHRVVHDESTRNFMSILLLRCEFVEEIAHAREFMTAQRENCVGQVAGEFQLAIDAGQLPASLPAKEAAIGMLATMDGVCMHWLFDTRLFDLEKLGSRVVDAYLDGLRTAS